MVNSDLKKAGGGFDRIERALNVMAIFDESYDGGKFCQGLLFSTEAMSLAFSFTNNSGTQTPNRRGNKTPKLV